MADKFWVGGTGTASDATNHWATTSGGSPGAGNLPTASDNVIFDVNSAGGAYTVTLATFSCIDFTVVSQPPTGVLTFAIGGIKTIFGNVTMLAGTLGGLGTFTLAATSGTKTITSAGVAMSTPTFNGVGGKWVLQDDFSTSTGSNFTLTNGHVDLNDKNVTTRGFSSSGSGTRVLDMGSGTFHCASSGSAPWSLSGTNFTLNPETSTIKISGGAGAKTFSGNNLTYNNLWITGTVTTTTITGSNTFNDFRVDTPPKTVLFTAGTTTTVNTFTVSGTIGNLITIGSVTAASHALVKSGSGDVSSDFLSISRSNASPADTWYAGLNSTDGGNNTGWIFGEPPPPTPTGCDVNTLLSDGNCFMCLPTKIQGALKTQLLCEIANP